MPKNPSAKKKMSKTSSISKTSKKQADTPILGPEKIPASEKKLLKKKTDAESGYNDLSQNSKQRLLLVILLIIVFATGAILTSVFYNSQKLLAYSEYNLSVNITESSTSFNTATDRIDFAKNYLGGAGTKLITLSSKKDSIVAIKATGDIAQFLSFSDNDFFLVHDERKEVTIRIDIPENSTLGEYTGKLQVYFYRP